MTIRLDGDKEIPESNFLAFEGRGAHAVLPRVYTKGLVLKTWTQGKGREPPARDESQPEAGFPKDTQPLSLSQQVASGKVEQGFPGPEGKQLLVKGLGCSNRRLTRPRPERKVQRRVVTDRVWSRVTLALR